MKLPEEETVIAKDKKLIRGLLCALQDSKILCFFPSNFHACRSCATYQLMKESSIRQVVLSGDIHVDPGPVRFLCSVCKEPVAATHRAAECDSCHQWCHIGRRCFLRKLQTYA